MRRQRFCRLVENALLDLPSPFAEKLQEVAVVVETRPSRAKLRELGMAKDEVLLGLYEGTPLTERGVHYGMVLPDRITIYQEPLEQTCRSDEEMVREIRATVIHEAAHFFGLSDEDLPY